MFNFQNIGAKIKTLAVVVTILGIAVSVVAGLYMINDDALSGVLVAFIGSVLSWISAFFVYGFGELIEKTTEIAKNTKKDIKVEIVQEESKK